MTTKFDNFHERLLNLLNEFDYMLDVKHGAIIVKDRSYPGLQIIGDFADDTVPEPEWQTYEVCHRDFVGDGTKDYLVFWVACKDVALVGGIAAEYKAACCPIRTGGEDVDFYLPRDNDRLRKALT